MSLLLALTSVGGLMAWLALSTFTAAGVTPPGASLITNAATRWQPGAVSYSAADAVGAASPAAATPLVCDSSGENSTGANLVIPADEVVCGDVLVIGGNLDADGDIRGSAQVIGGDASISGDISGNVTTIGGSITVLAGARIAGSAHAFGGTVNLTPGATVTNSGSDLHEPTDLARAPGLNFAVDAGSFWLSLLFWISAALGLSPWLPK